MRSSMIMVLALAVAAAPACGGDGADGGATLQGPLQYERSGGFAGVVDRLVIQSNGRAELSVRGSDPQTFTLSDDELTAVSDAVEAADLGAIDPDSTSDEAVADAFAYMVNYDGTAVRTDDASIPAQMQGLLTELDRIVRTHRSD